MQVHNQDDFDFSETPAQFQLFKPEQAQLIADLQHRLDHLAEVTANYDDQRYSPFLAVPWHLQMALQLMSSPPFHKAVCNSCSCLLEHKVSQPFAGRTSCTCCNSKFKKMP